MMYKINRISCLGNNIKIFFVTFKKQIILVLCYTNIRAFSISRVTKIN